MRSTIQQLPRTTAAALVAAAALLIGCSSDDSGLSVILTCGNGIVESGEQCDPGGRCADGTGCIVGMEGACASGSCVAAESESCSSLCQLPVCGDGFAQGGLEQCDTFDLRDSTCGTFGRVPNPDFGPAGGLLCTDDCRLDAANCGASFTPTATFTLTPLPSATPTVTNTFTTQPPTMLPTSTPPPTPTEGPACNLPILEPGEFAEDDQQQGSPWGQPETGIDCSETDIEIFACTPGSATVDVVVSFARPVGTTPTSVVTLLSYSSDIVSMPGDFANFRDTVPQFETLRDPAPFVFTVRDFDFASRVVFTETDPNNPIDGDLYMATFELCDGAAEPIEEDFACVIEGCSGVGGALAGCECNVAFAAEE